jgi:CheY-like chemotaxis protein
MTNSIERKAQILVIEDNPGDVSLLKLALRDAKVDCEMTVIDDGGAALDYFHEYKQRPDSVTPDLVVLDLNLPKNDGLEIMEAMRANPRFREVPVALFSSSSAASERSRLKAFHVGRYLAKPPDLDGFLRIGGMLKELLAETRGGDKF